MSHGLFQKHCYLCHPQAWQIIQVLACVIKTLKASALCLLNLLFLYVLRVPRPKVNQMHWNQHLPEAFSLRAAPVCCHWVLRASASAPGNAILLDGLSQPGGGILSLQRPFDDARREGMTANPSQESMPHSWLDSWQKEAYVTVTQRSDLLQGEVWGHEVKGEGKKDSPFSMLSQQGIPHLGLSKKGPKCPSTNKWRSEKQ